MTTFRSEDVLVGIVALGLVPWIVWTIVRGLRNESLPLGRSYVSRRRPGPFGVLLGFYIVAAILAVGVSADLLFNVDLWKLV